MSEFERVEREVDVQRLLPRADHRIAQRRAEHRGGADVALLPEGAGGNGRAVAAIDLPLQAGGAEERLGGGLAEILAVGEGVVVGELGLLAELG